MGLQAERRVKGSDGAGTISEFIIGDAGVSFHNQWCRRVTTFGSTGMACGGLQIFLPISPDRLLVLYDTDVYAVGNSNDDVVDVTSVEEVSRLNGLQFASATNALYYRSETAGPYCDALPRDMRAGELGIASGLYRADQGSSHLVHASLVPLNVDLVPRTQ